MYVFHVPLNTKPFLSHQVNLTSRLLQFYGPQKNKLSCGIKALQLLPDGKVLVGSGEGVITCLLPSLVKTKTFSRVSGSVTSIALGNKKVLYYYKV